MINLTFGEQVKIVLSRKGMTIKELAEQIEERTGKKMSRQNLTQRLGRDNFQEQDMRMIAEILGCSFQLSILASAEAVEKASVVEEIPPTGRELEKLLAKQKLKMDRAYAKKKAERDLTMGEFVDMMEPTPEPEKVLEAEVQPEAEAGAQVSEEETQGVPQEVIMEKEPEAGTEVQPEPAQETPKKESAFGKIAKIISSPKKEGAGSSPDSKYFQPIKKRVDEEEDLEHGDVNPYTGHEYQTNSVRTHPKRIGYVQVYDRKEHKWTDMTEWAFLGFEERKKATLGKDYEPPIYLD